MTLIIRAEQTGDEAAISALITTAFATAEHSSGTEAAIVEGLREGSALTLALVAEEAGEIVGHVACSPVTIDGADQDWFGLGPVAVAPGHQRQGIGDVLIRRGLSGLRAQNAKGCVVLGDPNYYRRFGFNPDPRLTLAEVPPEYFQTLAFGEHVPSGEIGYHPAFSA